jgi:hypothetical protein
MGTNKVIHMKDIIIKPVKPNVHIINPADCVVCIYRTVRNRKPCKSCGNWQNKLPDIC